MESTMRAPWKAPEAGQRRSPAKTRAMVNESTRSTHHEFHAPAASRMVPDGPAKPQTPDEENQKSSSPLTLRDAHKNRLLK
jgi:hypothetical protein